jgi:phytoene dehydrogenase-like protein
VTTTARTDAVVVGAGPNGLAAAVALARQGFRVTVLEAADEPGGGTRSTDQLTIPGVVHDRCSAVHPLAAASPFLRSLPLERHGLTWCHPEVAVAHPLDDGTAPVVLRDLDATVGGLGDDGHVWRRLFAGPSRRFDRLAADLLGPVVRVPRHLRTTTPVGVSALLPATAIARRFRRPAARALFGGIAAHAIQPLHRPLTSAVALVMTAAGHAHGWPVARGGSQAIATSLVSLLEELGGTVECGVRVTSLRDLPRSRVALLDLGPRQLAEIAGDALRDRAREHYASWPHGPAVFKVDYALAGGVPWTAPLARRAGTVHVIGAFEEIVEAEQAVHEGRMPDRPYMIAAQQYLADPERAVDEIVPFWVYAHVPHGYDGDASPAIEAQLERFAPGFRERVVARHVTTPADLEAYNPCYVGGDIAGGATDPWRLVARPRFVPDPYATGVPGLFLCSASTPPGAGAHGMCGYHAARSALRVLTA